MSQTLYILSIFVDILPIKYTYNPFAPEKKKQKKEREKKPQASFMFCMVLYCSQNHGGAEAVCLKSESSYRWVLML